MINAFDIVQHKTTKDYGFVVPVENTYEVLHVKRDGGSITTDRVGQGISGSLAILPVIYDLVDDDYIRECYLKKDILILTLLKNLSFYYRAHNKPKTKKYLSDFITDMDSWEQGELITVHAETGKGKSHWIKTALYEKAKSEGKRILFLIHRKASVVQFRDEIVKDGKEDIIDIQTYQYFDYHIDQGNLDAYQKHYKMIDKEIDVYGYIVCDEAHYFIKDASFNNETELMFKVIMKKTVSHVYS